MTRPNVALWFAYLLVMLAAVLIASPSEEPLRAHLGPFHPLEALVVAWAVAALLARRPLPRLRSLWPAALFFGLGCVGLTRDLLVGGELLHDDSTTLRLLQHCVLFIYPLLWMLVGTWLASVDRAVVALVTLVVIGVNTLPNLTGDVVSNVSLGPLTAVILAVCVDKAMSWRWRSPEGLAYWALSLAIALLTFTPYWTLWLLKQRMQRTSLLMLLFMLVATPLLRRKNLSALRNVLITLPVFVLGFFVATEISMLREGPSAARMSVAEHLSDNVLASLDKYGGYLDEHPAPLAMVSVRKFWWSTALDDWRASPVLGLGFIPEVPSRLGEGLPNDWKTVSANPRFGSLAPISGPHNSYLTILVRMGVIGLAAFALLIAIWLRSVWPLVRGRELNLYEILVVLIPVNGMIHAFLNVGLEAPRSCALLWFFAGAATVYASLIAHAEAEANSRD